MKTSRSSRFAWIPRTAGVTPAEPSRDNFSRIWRLCLLTPWNWPKGFLPRSLKAASAARPSKPPVGAAVEIIRQKTGGVPLVRDQKGEIVDGMADQE